MPNTSDKLRLGENHRRVVSVLLREVEKMCEAILEWLDKKPGLLLRVQDDLTAEQQARLRKLVEQLRGEIRHLVTEVTLDQRRNRGAGRSQHCFRQIGLIWRKSIPPASEATDNSRKTSAANSTPNLVASPLCLRP